MVRPIVTLAAVGAAGFLLWNLVLGFVLPLVFGIFALVIKVAFWAGLIALIIWIYRRMTRPPVQAV